MKGGTPSATASLLSMFESVSNLPDQTGEDKDADEEVEHLEGDLEGGDGLREAANVDEAAHGKVVAAQVPVDKQQIENYHFFQITSSAHISATEIFVKNLLIAFQVSSML